MGGTDDIGAPVATPDVLRRRAAWRYRGGDRPPFATPPSAGQESVWDYPRPPRIVPDVRHVVVRDGDAIVADSTRASRVLETAGAPTFYLPRDDVRLERLAPGRSRSVCEWKGTAYGLDLVGGPRDVAWTYPRTFPEFAPIEGWIAFYPGRIACFVDGERVRPQPGGYYGGWVTDEIVGPMKGEPIANGL
jgi:uncharacterized protein (DUF427 family)